MKLGYVALSMAVDVYIICEYEKDGEMYTYRDLIKIQHNGDKVNSVQIDYNPRTQRMHEEWWRKNENVDGISDLIKEAINYIFTGGHISTGKIE